MAWTAPRTWTNGETITADIMNTHIRDNLEFLREVPASCALYFEVNQGISNAWQVVNWTHEDHDPDGMHDNVTNNDRITIQETAKYQVGFIMLPTLTIGKIQVVISLNDNGSPPSVQNILVGDTETFVTFPTPRLSAYATRYLTAGDILRVQANASSLAGNEFLNGRNTQGPRSNGFYCFKVSDT